MRKLKLVLVLFMTALTLVFIAQNWEVVPLQFLFWSFEVPRLLLVLLLLLVGFILGVIYATFRKE